MLVASGSGEVPVRGCRPVTVGSADRGRSVLVTPLNRKTVIYCVAEILPFFSLVALPREEAEGWNRKERVALRLQFVTILREVELIPLRGK